jgi:kynureninase
MNPDETARHPNPLARHYSRFRVGERLLLTGHSHQAWPDRGFDGQQQAWLDAAELVDEKWERAFARADLVRRGFRRLLDQREGHIALASSTHDLLIRFLSALPLGERPRLVTTDGEFHTIRRQVDRLAEAGIELVKVPVGDADTLSERLAAETDGRTSAVLISAVLFQTARIVPNLGYLAGACERVGARLLVDAYHALNVTPFSIAQEGLERAFVVGGGYKYCQLGEGNCFLRFPPDCGLRPVVTGWFSEFDVLAEPGPGRGVAYGDGPSLFAGSTYDPTSHYRAAEVFGFFEETGMTPSFLRQVNRRQIALLARRFDQMDANPALIKRDRDVPPKMIGGFLTLQSPAAAELCAAQRTEGLLTDYRGEMLRLGPAPYLSDRQLHQAMDILAAAVKTVAGSYAP